MIANSLRRRLLTAAGATAVALSTVTALASATPAFATQPSAAPAHSVVAHGTRTPELRGFHVTVTSTTQPTVTHISPAVSCHGAITQRVNGYYFGILVWWVQMSTSWCYNSTVVTSHRTTMSHWTTGSYHYVAPSIAAGCIKAPHDSRNCSGNQENAYRNPMVYFQSGTTGYSWSVQILEKEYVGGGWYKYWRTVGYPF